MPIVKVGDQRIKFPDGMGQEEIQKILQDKFSKPKRDVSSLPEFQSADGLNAMFGSQFGDENTGAFQIFKDALSQTFTLDQNARRDGIKKRFPELEFDDLDDGNAVIRNPRTGAESILNAPGVSMQDIQPLVGATAAFSPTAKVATTVGTGLKTKAAIAGASAGATDIALQGAEKFQGSDQDFDAVRTAVTSGLTGLLTPLGPTLKNISESRSAKKLLEKATPTLEDLKDASRSIYKEIDNLGAKLKPEVINKMNFDIKKIARDFGFDKDIHPKVSALLNRFSSERGKSLNLTDIDTLRKVAQSAASSQDPSERALASQIINKIDDTLDELEPSQAIKGDLSEVGSKYKAARQLWARSRKSELIEEAFRKAGNQASGFENGIRTQFRSILNNKKKLRGFSKDEITQMERVVQGGKLENTAKFLGRFGFTEGQATSMLGSSVGVLAGHTLAGGPGAVAAPLIGQASKALAQRLTQNNAKLASNLVKAGNNSKTITTAYIKSLPKGQPPKAEELASLLLDPNVNIKSLKATIANPRSKNAKVIKDAISMALSQRSGVEASDFVSEI